MEEAFKVSGRLEHISITKQNHALKHLLLAVNYEKIKEGKVSFCTTCGVGLFYFWRDHGLPCFYLANKSYFCLEDQAVSTHQCKAFKHKQGEPLTMACFQVWDWQFHTLLLTAALGGARNFLSWLRTDCVRVWLTTTILTFFYPIHSIAHYTPASRCVLCCISVSPGIPL